LFETVPGEAPALLRGATEPSAAELVRRAAERSGYEDADPPLSFGPESAPPSTALPPAMATLVRAMMLMGACDHGEVRSEPAPGAILQSTGVSAGRFEGRARVVRGP